MYRTVLHIRVLVQLYRTSFFVPVQGVDLPDVSVREAVPLTELAPRGMLGHNGLQSPGLANKAV